MHSGKPLVFLGRWPDGVAADCIASNYRLGARLAVEHLIGLGHRHIAYIEGVPHFSGFSPRDGYADALAAAGMPLLKPLMRVYELPSEAAGQRGIGDLLKDGTEFTAVFARSDVTAVGVCRALKTAGLSIPRDVSVASVNNSQIAQLADPPLTSVDPFSVTLGREAFRLLRERIEGSYDGPIRRIMLDPSLRIGNSSASPHRAEMALSSTVR
jgi:DNA-binding LacI/PurR family transcriptional regulator